MLHLGHLMKIDLLSAKMELQGHIPGVPSFVGLPVAVTSRSTTLTVESDMELRALEVTVAGRVIFDAADWVRF